MFAASWSTAGWAAAGVAAGALIRHLWGRRPMRLDVTIHHATDSSTEDSHVDPDR